jgi:hypothetical protein
MLCQHPDYYENAAHGFPWGDVYNTAEESLAYSYNVSRDAGLPAGFLTTCKDLQNLTPDMVDLLVIPPVTETAPTEHVRLIRSLHEQGVNLLCFESACGLEDLFGISPINEKKPIHKIMLGDSVEYVEHELCTARYMNAGADAVLTGAETTDGIFDIPVLSTHKTKWGRTAFFNIPPTVVNRRNDMPSASYGKGPLSLIVRNALIDVIKKLSNPIVQSENVKLIAFHDKNDRIVIIVENDSQSSNVSPVVVSISNTMPENLSCDKDFVVSNKSTDGIVVKVFLKQHESAIIEIRKS